ncbi:hypothetical protein PPL_11113 [Heterostelium album PN500]|uniref:Uncharacterized protein n=1 Tax=Heterostelium pallidum (strain ATCC 26659 / Pp 5 / PN500) TaxID=670386 RepID=D3BSZ2_HETP5|nr:hypothetical protein PPL_11113 [Heterostelium album PN500]EFA75607.1 hypothetical protein PPL_11113 [Heterostelium album PN500]|eukprot:XP_020427741.1 hypothetical protein PPL_11113 [Heterostelium album PN500]
MTFGFYSFCFFNCTSIKKYLNLSISNVTMNNWDFSLFDCCSAPLISCISCPLCPCQIARQRATIKGRFGFGECLFSFCCLPCAACGLRNRIRNRYDIRGNSIGDCICICCCGCCTTVQQAREMDFKGDKPGGLFMPRPNRRPTQDEEAPPTQTPHSPSETYQ